MWPDNETETDFLNFSGVADTVAEIIVQANGRPISIRVSGAWGVGKSSMIKLIQSSLTKRRRAEGDREFIFVEFNVYPILDRYVRERRNVFGKEAGAGFFTSLTTGQATSESTLRRMVARVRRLSGVPFSMHSLRHSFVTTLLNADAHIHVMQALAGHAKIATTAMYLRVTAADLHREIQKLSFRQRAVVAHRHSS